MKAFVALAVAAALSAPVAGAAVKPKPWHWTTAQAAASLTAFDEIKQPTALGSYLGHDVVAANCTGKGKAVAKRYLSFRCVVNLQEGVKPVPPVTFWVRVRPTGKGEPCWSRTSLAAVPAACLNPKGARIRGKNESAGDLALQVSLGGHGGLYQGPIDCMAGGFGFFECAFAGATYDDPTAGRATVILLKSGAAVTVTKQPG